MSFKNELKPLMYGFGDVINPADDTLEMMEDILMMELERILSRILQHNPNSKIKPSDLMFAIRDDARKCARAHELIRLEKEIKVARKIDMEGMVGM